MERLLFETCFVTVAGRGVMVRVIEKEGVRREVHVLEFTLRARAARSRHGKKSTSFLPAISTDALKKISSEVRRDGRLSRPDL
jgi:hypothetical protein